MTLAERVADVRERRERQTFYAAVDRHLAEPPAPVPPALRQRRRPPRPSERQVYSHSDLRFAAVGGVITVLLAEGLLLVAWDVWGVLSPVLR